ncbi:MAG: hypothetical protein O2782_03475 [bacterium]|nr:hypothetical protein [bacterium]
MTVSQVGEETAVEPISESVLAAGPDTDPRISVLPDLSDWQVTFHEGLAGNAAGNDDGGLLITFAGAGELIVSAPAPIPVPANAGALQVTIEAPIFDESGPAGELFAQLNGGEELHLGPLDFTGMHILRHTLPGGRSIIGLAARALNHPSIAPLLLRTVAFETIATAMEPATELPSPYGADPSMLPFVEEDVTNSIEKDGISYILEARSLSAVVRYIYTPIEGSLSDFEVEINNGDAIKLAEDGGILVFMEGTQWSAADEEIARHFVSCEQVGDAIEARWQFRRGNELADFLYRLRIRGKSLQVEIEGGPGKAAGIDLGYVSGAIHPRLIHVPYFNLGDAQPLILSTAGVFISSYLDWYHSRASSMHGVPGEDDQVMHLNGGSRYRPASDGRSVALRDRWVLTVSRRFEEVLPSRPVPMDHLPTPVSAERVWCRLPDMAAGEEAYVEAYERLRMFRQVGLNDLLVLHPETTWHDGTGGVPALDTVGAAAKGGDDAFHEYLEAIKDLGYEYGLHASLRSISPHDKAWSSDLVALGEDGEFVATGPGRYLLKPSRAASVAHACIERLIDIYGASSVFLGDHAATPPWNRVDSDTASPASFSGTMRAEQGLLASLAANGRVPVVGDGGNHWLYDGLLSGCVARILGDRPADKPLLVDFALHEARKGHINAGLGTPEEFFGTDIPADERDSRSPWFDRYIAATLAFGHAAMLPDLELWGLPAVAKTYYLLRKLQPHYLGVAVESIHYQRGGNLLATTEALIAGAHELSQVRVVYRSGLQLHINGSKDEDWTIEVDEETHYRLPPGSFLAQGPGDLLVYSADTGAGRTDYATCGEYVYCDTRGQRLTLGAMNLNGAAVLTHEGWVIDVYPLDCTDAIEINPAVLWKGRRMPPLRVLAYRDEVDVPESLSAGSADGLVTIRPQDDVYRYRITLPEWMVEPGK